MCAWRKTVAIDSYFIHSYFTVVLNAKLKKMERRIQGFNTWTRSKFRIICKNFHKKYFNLTYFLNLEKSDPRSSSTEWQHRADSKKEKNYFSSNRLNENVNKCTFHGSIQLLVCYLRLHTRRLAGSFLLSSTVLYLPNANHVLYQVFCFLDVRGD